MVRAGYYGDVAVLRAMITAGVDEHGTPLSKSLWCSSANSAPSGRRRAESNKTLDKALSEAVGSGHIDAVQLLYSAGADLMTINTDALRKVVRAGGSEPLLEFLRNSSNSSMDSQIYLAIKCVEIDQGAASWGTEEEAAAALAAAHAASRWSMHLDPNVSAGVQMYMRFGKRK